MPARKPALGFIFVTLFLDVFGIGLIIPILPKGPCKNKYRF